MGEYGIFNEYKVEKPVSKINLYDYFCWLKYFQRSHMCSVKSLINNTHPLYMLALRHQTELCISPDSCTITVLAEERYLIIKKLLTAY